MAPSTFGATRWRGGIGISFRLAQYVSPSTPLDAQWSSERGGRNALGLITAHAHTRAIGMSDRRPSRLRLQIAPASSGGIGIRV
jgi:hypothetical protein